MKIYAAFKPELAKILREGGVGVIPTDTLYGLVASARHWQAIEKIYQIKNRNPQKPLIVLVANLMQLQEMGIPLTKSQKQDLAAFWPGPVSVVLPASGPDYLTRGQGSLAIRLPDESKLTAFLEKTGPLVAPSANPEGQNPAKTVEEAVKYFKEEVDFYVNGGELDREPSKIIKITEDGVEELRP